MVSRAISTLLTLPLTVLCGPFERFCPKIFVNISWRVDCTVLVTVAVPVLPCTTLSSAISTAVEQYSVFKVLPKMSLYFHWGEISRFWFVNFLLHFLARGTVSRDTSHCTLGNFFCELLDVFVWIHIFFTTHPYKRRNKKAPHKIELRQRIVLTRFRTALGSFSVLTDPAPLARLEIVSRYSVFNLSRRSPLSTILL